MRSCVRARWFVGVALAAALGSCSPRTVDGEAAPIRLRLIRTLGEPGRAPGQFVAPRVLDDDGEALWVIDKLGRVQRLDPETGDPLFLFTMPEVRLGKPVGMTVVRYSGGEIEAWVADTHYHRVMVYRIPRAGAEPELVRSFGTLGKGPGEFIYPTDLAVVLSPDRTKVERVYVAEYGGNDRIQAFDPDGNVLFAFGELGESSSPDAIEFNRPQCLALDEARGELLVVDACNHRIGRFTLDGNLIDWIGDAHRPGRGACEFRYPYSIWPAGDGTWWVCEHGNNRVQRVDLAARVSFGAFGVPGRGPGEFDAPWGVVSRGDRVWVLDTGNARIQVFGGRR